MFLTTKNTIRFMHNMYVDVQKFHAKIALPEDQRTSIHDYERAIALYRGEFMGRVLAAGLSLTLTTGYRYNVKRCTAMPCSCSISYQIITRINNTTINRWYFHSVLLILNRGTKKLTAELCFCMH